MKKDEPDVVPISNNRELASPRQQSFIVHEDVSHDDGVVSQAALSSMRGEAGVPVPKLNNLMEDAHGNDENARQSAAASRQNRSY